MERKTATPKRPTTRTAGDADTARALRERIKELSCLYSITLLSEKWAGQPSRIFQGIVELIPAAWQYPEITSAQILLDGLSYATPGFREGCQMQTARIIVEGQQRGTIRVEYTWEKPELDEGPFLKEERSLLEAIARQVAFVVQRQNAEEEKAKLQKQLMHADRLATIGQLAAGIAHELNEPLSNILGFAQLAQKAAQLPAQAGHDIDRIVSASLHAREIIRKLLLFARQTPTLKGRVDLNTVINEALGLFEHRLKKEAIELVRALSADLPELTADPGQMVQVLVNLVVNAIQAMPQGGTLVVETCERNGHVVCVVQDTGVGMAEEVLDRIFVPFFTTKDVNEGTGLGLPVVHGIVTSHGGTINVESKPGQGTRFEIRLPKEPQPATESDSPL